VRAPDYPRPLIGWRVWLVVETREGLRLASVMRDEVWPVGREVVARCRRSEDPFADELPLPPHHAPEAGCTCGFHALREPAAALPYLRGRNDPWTVCRALGTVALWDRVVESEHGWRAAHAYPVRLLVEDAEIRRELAPYRVEFAEPGGTSLAA
jgi:hypothetical protein